MSNEKAIAAGDKLTAMCDEQLKATWEALMRYEELNQLILKVADAARLRTH